MSNVELKVWDYSEDLAYKVKFAKGVKLKVFVDLFGQGNDFYGRTFAFDREREKIEFGDDVKESYSPVFAVEQSEDSSAKSEQSEDKKPKRFMFVVDEEVWNLKRRNILEALESNKEKEELKPGKNEKEKMGKWTQGLVGLMIDVIRNEVVFVWLSQDKNKKIYLHSKRVPLSCVDRAKDLKVYLGKLVEPYPQG